MGGTRKQGRPGSPPPADETGGLIIDMTPEDLPEGLPRMSNRAPSLRARALAPAHRRCLVAGGGLALVGIVAAVAIVVPLALPGVEASSSPLPESTDTSSVSVPTPTPEPTLPAWAVTPTPTEELMSPAPSFEPIVANGWPIALPPGRSGEYPIGYWAEAGPDGTIYITPGEYYDLDRWATLAAAVDAKGHLRAAWLHPPVGDPLPPPTDFGSDGSIYVRECYPWGLGPGYSACLGWILYAFDPDGTLRYQWGGGGGTLQILAGPSGTLYMQTESGLSVLGRDGSVTSTTSESVCYLGVGGLTPSAVIRPDGVLFAFCGDEQTGSSIQIFDPVSASVATATGRWQGMVMGPDGTVVVWYRDLGPHEEETPDTATAIHLAVMGSNGKPAAGWPVTVRGSASDPAVGQDGSVFVNVAPTANEPGRVVGLTKAGRTIAGWPVLLQMGTNHLMARIDTASGSIFGLSAPFAPTVGDGTVFDITQDATSQTSIYAFDLGGATRPGWPAKLPGGLGTFGTGVCIDVCLDDYTVPMYVPAPGGTGLLYLQVGSQILALTESGQVAPGWPKSLQGSDDADDNWVWWAAMPDGGLAVLERKPGDEPSTLTRWAPDGSLAH